MFSSVPCIATRKEQADARELVRKRERAKEKKRDKSGSTQAAGGSLSVRFAQTYMKIQQNLLRDLEDRNISSSLFFGYEIII